MQRPLSSPLHYRSLPLRTPKAAGSSSAGNGKNVAPAPRRRNCFHHCKHPHTTPVPHPTKPPSTSVAFFVMLRFSNLVRYIAILKTFHVRMLYLCLRRCNCFHHCRHCRATPVPPPHQATIHFRCIFCDAPVF